MLCHNRMGFLEDVIIPWLLLLVLLMMLVRGFVAKGCCKAYWGVCSL